VRTYPENLAPGSADRGETKVDVTWVREARIAGRSLASSRTGLRSLVRYHSLPGVQGTGIRPISRDGVRMIT
jgi:hypothetical protein